jgi:hypothetical protein
VDSSGRLAIGTTSPAHKLVVSDTTNNKVLVTGGSTQNGLTFDAAGGGQSFYVYTYSGGLGIYDNSSLVQRVTVDNSGRLLVGTSSTLASDTSNATIQVLGGTIDLPGIRIQATNSVNAGCIQLGNDPAGSGITCGVRITGDTGGGTTYNTYRSSGGDPYHAFAVNSTERMRITQAGRLLLGTTTSQVNEMLRVVRDNVTTNAATVDVYNSAATSTTKFANSLLRVSSQGSGAAADIVLTDNVTYNYFFGGNNGGAYVAANSNGVRLSNGGTSWASDSDERVKDIIETIDNGLTKVASLRSVIGKYKSDSDDKRRSFLIAQDVQVVLPEAVYDEQGTLMLAYTDVIPLLVSALKESKERIETLEAKVAVLEAA